MGSLPASGEKRLCIIGAGLVGLLAIKHINQTEGLMGTVFEQLDRISGLWHYVEDKEHDVNGLLVHSALYNGLRTNIVKELLQLDDLKFPDYEESYIPHKYIDQYFNDYANKFNLRPHIQLNTKVLNVKPIENAELAGTDSSDFHTKWSVEVYNYTTNAQEQHIFDGVIVANGKFSEPIVPEINGINDFEGRVVHSKFYRRPEELTNQNVVVLGLGPSAMDIAFEIAGTASNVTISHRTVYQMTIKKINIIGSCIDHVTKNSVVLENGSEIPCDVLLLGTGYKPHFPFLDPACGITVEEGKYVTPLFRHLHNVKYPTLCFPNIFSFSVEWTTSEIQVRYLMKYFQGHVLLPPEDERRAALESQEAEWKSKNIPVRHYLRMGLVSEEVYPYLVSLAEQGGIPETTRYLELRRIGLFTMLTRLFTHNEVFRNDRFRWVSPTSATYHCYADPAAGEDQDELLTLELDESTNKVNVTSSLGEIKNRPFFS